MKTISHRFRAYVLRAANVLARATVPLILLLIITGMAYAAVESGPNAPQHPLSWGSWKKWWVDTPNSALIAFFTVAGNGCSLFFGAFTIFWSKAAREAEERHIGRLQQLQADVGGDVGRVHAAVSRTEDKLSQLPASLTETLVSAFDLHFRASPPEKRVFNLPEAEVKRNIGLVVNARGKLCFVYDAPFSQTVEWVSYNIDARQLEVFFFDGPSYPVDWRAPNDMNTHLRKSKSIMLLRMENNRPVEGYDIPLKKTRGPFIKSVKKDGEGVESPASSQEGEDVFDAWVAAMNSASESGHGNSKALVLPARPTTEMSDAELNNQPCVVVTNDAMTYAGLPIRPASQELIVKFSSFPLMNIITNLDQFDVSQLRVAEARSLAGAIVFLPCKNGGVQVPFFMSEDTLCLARRENDWIYDRMCAQPPPDDSEIAGEYIRLFFTTVVGFLGRFCLAGYPSDVDWLPEADSGIKATLQSRLQPMTRVGTSRGRVEFRGTVLFKDALFVTSVMMTRKWEVKLEKEKLLMEELPVKHGPHHFLAVRR